LSESFRFERREEKMTPKSRIFDPNSGGIKIPPAVQADVDKRIRTVADREFKGDYTRLDIRFRNQFCYIDAYTEPVLTESWPPADWAETREECAERLRNSPFHLCRLRYFGNHPKNVRSVALEQTLEFFLLVGNKPAVVRRVAELTGAGLRMARDFVDGLQ
jgi:hypothetical protein